MSYLALSSDATQSRWEDVRDDIQNWYLNEGCGLGEVRRRLNEKHQFTATKFQLENQFDKWGFRKNLTKADWKVIKRKIEKRRREGEESEVWRDGRQMDPKRVKRAIARYRLSPPIQSPSPPLPRGISIGAPQLSIEMPREMSLSNFILPQPNMNPMVCTLPIVEFAPSLVNLSGAVDGFYPGADLISSVSSASEILLDIATYFQRDECRNERTVSSLCALQKIIPTAVFPDLFSDTIKNSPKPDEVWGLLVYIISNKLMNFTSFPFDATHHWIKQHLGFGWAPYLSRSKGPTIEAFLEQFFLLAVEREDSQMVRDLLSFASGRFHPDQILCRGSDFRKGHVTPLQRSCELKNLELSKILLNAGADVNYTPRTESSLPHCNAPLDLALSPMQEMTPEGLRARNPSLDQVKLLINAGANANVSTLHFAVRIGDVGFVRILLTMGICPNQSTAPFKTAEGMTDLETSLLKWKHGKESLLMTALESNIPVKDKIAIFLSLVHAGADVKKHPDGSLLMMVLESDTIPTKEKITIILSLVHAGANVKYSRVRSVRWSEHSVIHRHSSRSDSPYYRYGSPDTTDDDEISSHLVQRSGQEHHSLLTCAVQQSNDSLIDTLMRVGAPITTCALNAAVAMDRLDLVKVFLESGIQPNGRAIEFAVRSERNDILQLLLDNSDATTRESHTRRSFVEMLRYGHTELANHLSFEHICLFPADGYFNYCLGTAIESAARRSDTQTLQKIFINNSSNKDTFWPFLDVALAESIVQRNTEVISMLLFVWSDLDTDSDYGGESLEAAIAQRDFETSKKLLELGVGPTAASLREAIEWGNLSLISDLLDIGEGYEDSCQYMWSWKSLRGHIGGVGTEADARDDPCSRNMSYPDKFGEGPLTTSIKFGHHDVTQLLLAAGVEKESYSEALESAISTGDMKLVSLILNSGARVSEFSLVRAICWARDLVKILLERKSDCHCPFSSGFGVVSLQVAICLGDYALIESFLSNGVSPDRFASIPFEPYKDFDMQYNILYEDLWSELERYCDYPYPSLEKEVLLSKLRRGVINNLSPFGTAIEIHEDDEIIQLLLRYGADPNEAPSNGSKVGGHFGEFGVLRIKETPLLRAISKDNPGLVRILLDAGAEVNPKQLRVCRRTPLQRAAEIGSIQLVRLLLDEGANVNAPACVQRGATALQLAAIEGHLDAVLLLLSKGADVNAWSARVGGRTAIEGAAEHGRIDTVELLLSAGARLVGDGSKQYEKALRLATENSHMAVHRLLQKHHRLQLDSLKNGPLFNLEADQLIGSASDFNFEDLCFGSYIGF